MATVMNLQQKRIPPIVQQFLNDPRTTNLRNVHRMSIHLTIVVKRGAVIAKATNRVGTRSRGSGFSTRTIHSEKAAIKDLGDISKLRGADMYVMRMSREVNEDGECHFMNSKPCPDCELFLEKCMREYGLKNVYYTS